jgi:hypothetical protein
MTRPLRRSFCLLLVALMTQAGCGRVGPDAGTKGPGAGASPVNLNLPVEPLPTHPQVELSNLRFGRGKTGHEKFSVDWRVTKKSEVSFGMTLIIKPVKGHEMKRPIGSINKTSGTFSAEYLTARLGGQDPPTLESGCEMYVVIQQHGDHKVSNSVTSGNAPVTPTRPYTP